MRSTVTKLVPCLVALSLTSKSTGSGGCQSQSQETQSIQCVRFRNSLEKIYRLLATSQAFNESIEIEYSVSQSTSLTYLLLWLINFCNRHSSGLVRNSKMEELAAMKIGYKFVRRRVMHL